MNRQRVNNEGEKLNEIYFIHFTFISHINREHKDKGIFA